MTASEQALDDLLRTPWELAVVIQGAKLCTSPELVRVIEGQLHLRGGFEADTEGLVGDMADDLFAMATELHQTRYYQLRRSALVHSYSLLEYFHKALFLDYSDQQPDRVSRLVGNSKIRVAGSTLLDAENSVRAMHLADALWQEAGQGRPFAERCYRFLIDFCDPDLAEVLKPELHMVKDDLNEFNRVRTSIVHHGSTTATSSDQVFEKNLVKFFMAQRRWSRAVFDASPFGVLKKIL